MSAALEIQQAIEDARALVGVAREVWAAGNARRIAEAPDALTAAVECVRRADELLLCAPPDVRRRSRPRADALAREVAQLGQLVDSSAAFHRGIAARVQGAGVSYDPCGYPAAVPESPGAPPIEV